MSLHVVNNRFSEDHGAPDFSGFASALLARYSQFLGELARSPHYDTVIALPEFRSFIADVRRINTDFGTDKRPS